MVNPAQHQCTTCDAGNGRDVGMMLENERVIGEVGSVEEK